MDGISKDRYENLQILLDNDNYLNEMLSENILDFYLYTVHINNLIMLIKI